MTVTLSTAVERSRIERVEADLAVVLFFASERPLRGAAARADWRVRGLITELLRAGHLRGEVGEAALLPGEGRLRAGRILALGLGERQLFSERAFVERAADAADRCGRLRVGSVAFALPAEATTGVAAERAAAAVVAGFAESLARRPAPLRLLLVADPAEARRAAEGVAHAAERLQGGPVRVRPDPGRRPAAAHREGLATAGPVERTGVQVGHLPADG